jgi:hypothetical protein
VRRVFLYRSAVSFKKWKKGAGMILIWSQQRAGKNGIADALKQVEPIRHGLVFVLKRRFLKIRRFIDDNSNSSREENPCQCRPFIVTKK